MANPLMADPELIGKVAVVTGASRGIGRASAVALAAAGADVIVAYHEDADSAHAVVEEIRALGRAAVPHRVDLARKDGFRALVDAATHSLGGLHVLVNAAGVACWSDVWDVTLEEWEQQFDVNARSVFFLAVEAARVMREQRWGRIINITSITGRRADARLVPYGASKAAADMVTSGLAAALGGFGICVNAILPGTVETDMNTHVLRDEQVRGGLVTRTPAGRLGAPADISGAVVYFASPRAEHVNGASLVIDGGFTC